MHLPLVSALLALSAAAPFARPPQGEPPRGPNALDRAAGWRALFDGTSTAAWRGFGRDGFPDRGWVVEDGCLRVVAGAGGGDLVTTDAFGDFELELEWRVAPGGNSGVKLRVDEVAGPVGIECQLLDDAAHADGAHPRRRAGAMYDLVEPAGAPPAPAGAWHRTRIVARGDRVEHWLDGVRVVAVDLGSDEFAARLAQSKFAGRAGFGRGRGRILLQDHGDDAWFRDVRVRDLEALPGQPVELFDGTTLAGWRPVGDAEWSVEDGTLLGATGGGSQSFLVTERSFGDFLLEVDLRLEGAGNSGLQIRSHQREDGRVFGYQVEVDPSDRAWSGGLYDEARRGWLQDLADDPRARAALDRHGWNTYRVECVGPRVRTWVNGVPVVDAIDFADLEGFLALQVHSGQDTRVRWRNFRMRDLGTRGWRPAREDDRLGPSAFRIEFSGMVRVATSWPDLPLDRPGVLVRGTSNYHRAREDRDVLFVLHLADLRCETLAGDGPATIQRGHFEPAMIMIRGEDPDSEDPYLHADWPPTLRRPGHDYDQVHSVEFLDLAP